MLGRAIRADETVRGAPRLAVIGLDARVLLFTLVVSVSTGLLFGLLCCRRSGRPACRWSTR